MYDNITSLMYQVHLLLPHNLHSSAITVRLTQTEFKVTEEDRIVNVGIEALGGQLKRPVSVIVNTHDGPPGPTSAEGNVTFLCIH